MDISIGALTRTFQWATPDDENDILNKVSDLHDPSGRINLNSELATITKAVVEILPHRKEYGLILENKNYARAVVEIVSDILYNIHGCWRDSKRAYLRAWIDLDICYADILAIVEELDWMERKELQRRSAEEVQRLRESGQNRSICAFCIQLCAGY